jgi:ABC-type spermidine/putrescine transport system permease subunit I
MDICRRCGQPFNSNRESERIHHGIGCGISGGQQSARRTDPNADLFFILTLLSFTLKPLYRKFALLIRKKYPKLFGGSYWLGFFFTAILFLICICFTLVTLYFTSYLLTNSDGLFYLIIIAFIILPIVFKGLSIIIREWHP